MFLNGKMTGEEMNAVNRLNDLTNKLKLQDYLVIEKALWVGNVEVDINHIDNDLSKRLNYEEAFEKMILKLNKER